MSRFADDYAATLGSGVYGLHNPAARPTDHWRAPHGLEARYRRGCRCPFCREAARRNRAARRARQVSA